MVLLDANMILRYLLDDNEIMAKHAALYIDSGSTSVTIEVIAEVIYVLKGVYLLDRHKIAKTIQQFLSLVRCRDEKVLMFALDTFDKHNLDFVDCILYAYYKVERAEIATFDKQLLRLMEQQ